MQNTNDKIKQKSSKWLDLRLGKVTASNFSRILTGTGKPSSSARAYMFDIITEIMTGIPKQITSRSIEWGNEHEDEARFEYELRGYGLVDMIGYIEFEDGRGAGRVGGSPDGLCAEEGIVELKCPYNSIYHIKHLAENYVKPEYIPQMQGYMWITNRKWCDYVTYDPRMEDAEKRLCVTRIYRDDKYITLLEKSIFGFLDKLDNYLLKL